MRGDLKRVEWCVRTRRDCHMDNGMLLAARRGHIDVVLYLIKQGATGFEDAEIFELLVPRINSVLLVAVSARNIDYVRVAIDKGATNLNTALVVLAATLLRDEDDEEKELTLEMVRLLVDRGATAYQDALCAIPPEALGNILAPYLYLQHCINARVFMCTQWMCDDNGVDRTVAKKIVSYVF